MTTEEEFVPPGWSVRPLHGLCASMQSGPRQRAEDKGRTQADGGTPVVLPGRLRGGRIYSEDPAAVPTVPWDHGRALARYELKERDILITRTGTVGRCALVTGDHKGWLFHPNLVRLTLPEEGPADAAYLVSWLGATVAQDWIRMRSQGAVIPSLSIRTLGELPVLLPPRPEQVRIGATLAALDDKIQAHTEMARATRAYREVLADALLNGLLSDE